MHQMSRFSVCRSLFRRNPFTRWSSEPILSSLISHNPTSSNLITLISKFHPTFNYPPQISSGIQYRKFSGEPATERKFSDGYVEKEISEVHFAIIAVRGNIGAGNQNPVTGVMILKDIFNAFMKNMGLDNENTGEYPLHLQRFRKKIQLLKETLNESVAYVKFYTESIKTPGVGGASWDLYKRSGEAAAKRNFDYVDLDREISEVYGAVIDARNSIQLGILPPLDAVRLMTDKFKAFRKKFCFHNKKAGDYPLYLERFRPEIHHLEEEVDETVAYGEHVAARKDGRTPCWHAFKDRYESYDPSMWVDYDVAVVADNLADNTNQGLLVEFPPKQKRSASLKGDEPASIATPRIKTPATAAKVRTGVHTVTATGAGQPHYSDESRE